MSEDIYTISSKLFTNQVCRKQMRNLCPLRQYPSFILLAFPLLIWNVKGFWMCNVSNSFRSWLTEAGNIFCESLKMWLRIFVVRFPFLCWFYWGKNFLHHKGIGNLPMGKITPSWAGNHAQWEPLSKFPLCRSVFQWLMNREVGCLSR